MDHFSLLDLSLGKNFRHESENRIHVEEEKEVMKYLPVLHHQTFWVAMGMEHWKSLTDQHIDKSTQYHLSGLY